MAGDGSSAAGGGVLAADRRAERADVKSTAESSTPIYVGVGNRISLPTAVKLVTSLCKHRIPEPIRLADIRTKEQLTSAPNQGSAVACL